MPVAAWVLQSNPASVATSANVAEYVCTAGTASASRLFVVAVGTETNNASPNAVTIDGVTANAGALATLGAMNARLFYLQDASGTSKTIRVTMGATCAVGASMVALYTTSGGVFNSQGSASDTDADPITATAVVPAGGGGIAVVALAADTTARTPGGFTESLDVDAGTFRFWTGTVATATTATISVSGANAEDGALSYLTLKPGFLIVADAASYAVSGTAATLKRGFKVLASATSFAVTGTDATLTVEAAGIFLTASAAAFTVTGNDASLERGFRVLATAGAFSVTGTDATFPRTFKLIPDAGAFSFTGTAATLREPVRILPAEAGDFAVSGTDADLFHGYKLIAEAGAYAFTGSDADLRPPIRPLDAEGGEFLFTGFDADFSIAAPPVVNDRPLYGGWGAGLNKKRHTPGQPRLLSSLDPPKEEPLFTVEEVIETAAVATAEPVITVEPVVEPAISKQRQQNQLLMLLD